MDEAALNYDERAEEQPDRVICTYGALRVSSLHTSVAACRCNCADSSHDALGDVGATFWELDWKEPIFSGRVVPKNSKRIVAFCTARTALVAKPPSQLPASTRLLCLRKESRDH